ncbi:23S rRNA pseudouridine(1911/1915/1917) synthase RluD [Candidatus Marithrix sp. Canyon 246]|uniref:23S rRNA pseudouridine(1911/1915/1917) synthase RluD n=2 Tax=Candidatus Marithrix sp. Canyon 246 TaxID=1827136 RepID=UPI00084A1749|nr:23S rRNA pseudouridine(1911/1915/1917) synthase RluD [Candidatus Marithrix sp. Canyon 246]
MCIRDSTHIVTKINITIPPEMAGYRLDKALAELCPSYSRGRLQQWIRDGYVLVNQTTSRAKNKVQGGENIEIATQITTEVAWQAQKLPLNILYEDEDLLIINKAAGVVVHPGAGNPDKTLVNALLHHAPELEQIPRAGIIHRIDKDTSGLLVVARSLTAHADLVQKLQQRKFIRKYEAIVHGVMVAGSTIDAPIGRHPTQRVRMAVVENGKPAITHYRIIERYRNYTHISVKLETGRTHQIRVHMAYKRYPLLGDPVYGGRRIHKFKNFNRQALHAASLGLDHPNSGEFMQWTAALPDDILKLLEELKQDKQEHA